MRLLEPRGAVRLRVAAAGDVGLIGSARHRGRQEGYDAALAALAPAFRAADLAFANFEMPVGRAEWIQPGRSAEFWQDAEVAAALARAGVRVVSVANNHAMDCGVQGLEATLAACREAGMIPVGAGPDLESARAPARLEAAGLRVVLLAYAATEGDGAGPRKPGIAPLDSALMLADVARWRPEADVLIVSAHWGSMYVDYPAPRVIELARALDAAGVDLVLGHHPHVTQGFRRGRGLTLFSLGEAAFNCRSGDFHASLAADLRREAGIFTAVLAREPGLEYYPLWLDEDGFPEPAAEDRARRQRDRLLRISEGLEESATRFHAESAPQLLSYQIEKLGHYVRQGRVDRIVRMIATFKPRHVPLLWHAVRRSLGRSRAAGARAQDGR